MTAGVALVSGGARGIGRACVRQLAQDGYDVSFCYRADERAATELEKELGEEGTRVLAVRADVTDGTAVREWVSRTERELGPVTTAVTAAGITADTPLATMPDDKWASVLRTNLDGVFTVCRAVAYPMMKRRAGSITTLSSVSGIYGNAGQTNYAASKAGIIGFTKSLAREVGRFGVRANVVAPGLIDTDMTDAMPEKARTTLIDSIALRRAGSPEEVAELVGFLSSEQAGYITGSVLEIHGGYGG
ncbi:3-oxoacyl-ACP reductase FabG [Amycolatopsis sp. 195334CR]|uniref:3-oxoacyl-ACP reductase FabG n=1 Tax=Amycolatopsis sp. 195334CR TaxID=2814588 RepID=UPI001A8E6E79|nr:3-oxoacyl-ACP reductase FabG [Amycolatopsis sp. 195334CR]MBN6039708.1 3-oxoacyl-ACP reductase FabG [Amycolatopsis sp. 195334CR]